MKTSPEHRESFGNWLNDAGFLGIGVEVGCAFGWFSELVLSQWKGTKLFMVDPWEKQPQEIYREKTDCVDYSDWFVNCSRIAERDQRVTLVRQYSVDGCKLLPDGECDWVYIDANHSYRHVLEDMDAWWPKVKSGGLLCGHDCYHDTTYPHWCEVKPAVERWAAEHQYEFTITPCSSWWILKR